MIPINVILGFVGIVGAAVVCSLLDQFYDEFAKWLRTIPKLVEKAVEGILVGVKTFVNAVKQGLGVVVEMSKNYSMKDDRWFLTTSTRNVSTADVPDEILSRANGGELDITDELELKMTGGR